jgi:hypothetical protein
MGKVPRTIVNFINAADNQAASKKFLEYQKYHDVRGTFCVN